jgi:hypothetical protein
MGEGLNTPPPSVGLALMGNGHIAGRGEKKDKEKETTQEQPRENKMIPN